MKQIIEELRTGSVRIADVPTPGIGSFDVLIKVHSSLISAGTEKLLIEMGKKSLGGKALARPDLVRLALAKARREGYLNVLKESLARLDTPLPLGYSAAGTVVEAGSKVRRISRGAPVACAGSAFANHAEFVAVPEPLCVPLPKRKDGSPKVPFENAAFVMLAGIALHSVREADVSRGDTVVVIGLGVIGLLIAQIAAARGAVVIATDIDERKVHIADGFPGVEGVSAGGGQLDRRVFHVSEGRGADAILLAAATKDNSPFLQAEQIARRRANIVLVGVSDIHLTRKAFWDKELVFKVSKAAGPSEMDPPNTRLPNDRRWSERKILRESIRLMELGAIDTTKLVSHRFDISRAEDAYKLLLEGKEPYLGVLLGYNASSQPEKTVDVQVSRSSVTRPRRSIALIGAGMFTRNVLLPRLAKAPDIRLVAVAGLTGVNAQHIAAKYGFTYATTDYERILHDSEVDSVIITTRHHQHADMVAKALTSGKRVYVEKPLGISRTDVKKVESAFASSDHPILFVGYNRRYAPLAREAREFLRDRSTPIQVVMRVNAGYIPGDHWVHDAKVGGGRITGEVCHFVDLLQFLTGSDPISACASSIEGRVGAYRQDDNVSLTVRCSDGSVGTIIYTAMGTKGFSRERIEAFSEGRVIELEDFRTLTLFDGMKKKRSKLRTQDMGYQDEIEAFLALDWETSAKLLHDAALTTKTTIAAIESLRKGGVVPVARRRSRP